MSVIEVRLGPKDRDRLGVGDTRLTVRQDDLLDATFEQVHAWELAFDVSLHYLLYVDLQARTARAKKALAFLACATAGIEVGAYKTFTIAPNRCQLVEVADDADPPVDSSATSSETSPSEIG